jgi:hypothetical protein
MRRRTVRSALGLAAIALGLVAAGCVPGPPGPASLQVTPSPADFPTIGPPYNPMPIVQVTIKNTGGNTVHSLVVNGVGVYSVPNLGEGNNCFDAPANGALASGQSCVVDIQFCPTTSGTYDNTLMVTGQDAGTGASVQGSTLLHGIAT